MVLLSKRNVFNFPSNSVFCRVVRYYSPKVPRPQRKELYIRTKNVEIDNTVVDDLESNATKYRHHAGRFRQGALRTPLKFEVALLNSSSNSAVEMLRTPARELYNYLSQRRLPLPERLLEAKIANVRRQVVDEMIENVRKVAPGRTDEELDSYVLSRERQIERRVRERMNYTNYHWCPIDYNSVAKCLTYALARFASDFAVLQRIFGEIRKRDTEFRPKNVYDFGSGVGSTLWATEATWPDSVADYFCVDTCASMNETLNLLIRNGEHNGPSLFKANVYARRFLAATTERTSDIVVSAFTLMEIPSYVERMRVIANLWEKTGKYLVLVENGNRYGFMALLEARDYILAGGREIWRKNIKEMLKENGLAYSEVEPILADDNLTEERKYEILKERYKNAENIEIPTLFPRGYVYAPCPHDFGCPKLADVFPCKFEQMYYPLQLMDPKQQISTEWFTYVVLKKGKRDEHADVDASVRWPRIVSDPLVKPRCVRCDLCTPKGILAEVPVTKQQHDRHVYRMARQSHLGDLLPMTVKFEKLTKSTENVASVEGDTNDNVEEEEECNRQGENFEKEEFDVNEKDEVDDKNFNDDGVESRVEQHPK